MSSIVFNRHRYRVQRGDFRIGTAVVRMLLARAGFVPDPDMNVLSDVTNEMTTAGYARQTLSGLTVVEDDAADRAPFSSSPADFAAIGDGTQTASWAVLFERAGGADAASDPLICALDLPETLTVGDTLRVLPSATGWTAATA